MPDAKPLDDSKVMDIAKPGKSKPMATSRPVIATRPTLAKDPEAEAAKTEETSADDAVAPSLSKRIISPISEDLKPDADQVADVEPAAETEPAEQPEESMGSDAAGVDALADAVQSKKQTEKETEELQKREAAVQELIDSKKYFVPLAHDSTKKKSSKAPWAVLIILIILTLGGYALIDLGTIDPGFDVPYHILKK